MRLILKVSGFVVAAAVAGFAGAAGAQEKLPAGPYQLRGATFATVGATFDEAAVRAALPKNLQPADGFTGGFNFYIAPEGYGLAPFSAGYVWVDVKGHATEAATGRFIVAAFYSDKAFQLLKPLGVAEGSVAQSQANGVVTATATPAGGTTAAVTLTLKPGTAACTPVSGVHNYIAGPNAQGVSDAMFVVPYMETSCAAEPVSVDIAAEPLATFKPKSLTWADWGKDGALVLGIVAPLSAQ